MGRDCRKQVQYNGNLYVAVHDSDNVYTVWKCGLDYENAQVLSSFDDITDMVAGDKYLYVACGDGITRYDGSAIQKLPLGISGVVGMDAFTFNNGEQLIVATQSDVYHVSEQLDVFKMDTVDIDE